MKSIFFRCRPDPVELGTSHSVADSSSGVVLASMELHSRYMIYRRLFLQLMAKYLLSDRAFSEVERENPEEDREEARAAYLGILVNVVQFASQVVAGSGKKMRGQGDGSLGAAAMECLFGPSLVEGTAREVQRINGMSFDSFQIQIPFSYFVRNRRTLSLRVHKVKSQT